jgi:hypothetical protein
MLSDPDEGLGPNPDLHFLTFFSRLYQNDGVDALKIRTHGKDSSGKITGEGSETEEAPAIHLEDRPDGSVAKSTKPVVKEHRSGVIAH